MAPRMTRPKAPAARGPDGTHGQLASALVPWCMHMRKQAPTGGARPGTSPYRPHWQFGHIGPPGGPSHCRFTQ